MRAILCFVLGLAAGAIAERNFDTPRTTAPAKVIDWRPADRYEMMITGGQVFRLDRATGDIDAAGVNFRIEDQ